MTKRKGLDGSIPTQICTNYCAKKGMKCSVKNYLFKGLELEGRPLVHSRCIVFASSNDSEWTGGFEVASVHRSKRWKNILAFKLTPLHLMSPGNVFFSCQFH